MPTPTPASAGLGKTVQVIAYLAGLQAAGLYRPSLVVCPATVLRQWLRELRAWAPTFRVTLFHDSARCPPGAGQRLKPLDSLRCIQFLPFTAMTCSRRLAFWPPGAAREGNALCGALFVVSAWFHEQILGVGLRQCSNRPRLETTP